MEHSSGEATRSKLGVQGDLGLLAKLEDPGTEDAVELLRQGGSTATCPTSGPDDMGLNWQLRVSGSWAWSSLPATEGL